MATRPLFWVAGSHVSKLLNLNISDTKRAVAPKQKYIFPSVGDHIHATPSFEYAPGQPQDKLL